MEAFTVGEPACANYHKSGREECEDNALPLS